MAEKVNGKLFSEFAPNTMQEWIDKVTADLKGADFNKKTGLYGEPMKVLMFSRCTGWRIWQTLKIWTVSRANTRL